MRLRSPLAVLTLLLAAALAGCTPSADTSTAPSAQTSAEATYADRWQFPEQVAGFKRVEVKQTGSGDTRQAIAGYNLDSAAARIAITVTVYRPPAATGAAGAPPIEVAERQFVAEKTAILKAHGLNGPIPPSTAGSITAAGKEHPGLVAKFSFDEVFAGKPTAVDSHAYHFLEGDWAVKYRVTFPSSTRAASEARVAEFMSQLAWP